MIQEAIPSIKTIPAEDSARRSFSRLPAGRSARHTTTVERLVQMARWLQQTCSRSLAPRSRRLCVRETVSLGEKRFVSIVQVDGRDYLIGGGSANVSLLTQLGQTKDLPYCDEVLDEVLGGHRSS